jgi:hypothetical protein
LACGANYGIPICVIRVVLLIMLCACGPASKTEPVKPAAAGDPTCPVLVAGTSVTVEDTDQGAAFVFVTTGDVAGVRTRATALAEMHNQHHAAIPGATPPLPAKPAGLPPSGNHSGHEGHMQMPPDSKMQMGAMISIHSTAATTEIPNGARVTFTAASADDAGKLQTELRMHAQHLASGSCVM